MIMMMIIYGRLLYIDSELYMDGKFGVESELCVDSNL